MKIAVTSEGPDLDSHVAPQFGRCPYVLLVETDDMCCQAITNPYATESGGAGSRLAGLVASRGAKLVLAGSVGPHAQQALEAAGTGVLLKNSGTVRQAVESYMAGQRVSSEENSASSISSAPLVGGSSPDGRQRLRRHRRSGRGRRQRRGPGGYDEHGFYL